MAASTPRAISGDVADFETSGSILGLQTFGLAAAFCGGSPVNLGLSETFVAL